MPDSAARMRGFSALRRRRAPYSLDEEVGDPVDGARIADHAPQHLEPHHAHRDERGPFALPLLAPGVERGGWALCTQPAWTPLGTAIRNKILGVHSVRHLQMSLRFRDSRPQALRHGKERKACWPGWRACFEAAQRR